MGVGSLRILRQKTPEEIQSRKRPKALTRSVGANDPVDLLRKSGIMGEDQIREICQAFS